jgi:hypothetical protein
MARPVDSSDLEHLGGDLRQEMSTMGANLRQEMSTMAAELRQEIQASAAETRLQMEQFQSGILAGVDESAAETQLQMEQFQSRILSRVDESAAETRRYFGVVAEDLKSDIKAVAEGLGALDEKVERFRGEVREDFGKVDRRLLHLEVRVIGRSEPT